jgi:Cu+-exporting ATPase
MEDELASMKRSFIISLNFLVPLFYLAMGHMMGLPVPNVFHGTHNAFSFALTQFLLLLPILYANDRYFRVGLKTLVHGAPNMDSLIAIGSAAAVVYGVTAHVSDRLRARSRGSRAVARCRWIFILSRPA